MTRKFDESVTDEDLKKLPVVQFEGRVRLVDDMQKFRHAIDEISKCKLLGFDTETRPSFKKGTRHKVSLLQLADDRIAWLFRLNMIGFRRNSLTCFQILKLLRLAWLCMMISKP